jgi:hypothetical protein
MLERSNNQAGGGRDTKFKPLVLGEIHAADDTRSLSVSVRWTNP